ncbi:50S ribosomal protein L28 [Neorickettsia helminthoeca]|uniref:50S ribosomal protein L28 n=1 Tax=Neorickettsia helminthoeca TaxID=33994 RepID=UPI00056EB124|nr:50S ribosomal protein L28 [Neorickettsia helminthoeca]
MSNACELTGHKWQNGNTVSHSNRKSKRKFMPNLQDITVCSQILNQRFRFKVSVKTIRTIDFKGGLDDFLVNTKNAKLSKAALALKKRIAKRIDASTRQEA